jgi:hypothetical protein
MRTFWFTLATDIVNAVVRGVLSLLLGNERAEKAFKPVMKTLIVVSAVVILGLVIGVLYFALSS